jgi:hypothetical protein
MRALPLGQAWRALGEDPPGSPPRLPFDDHTAVVGRELGPVRYLLDAETAKRYSEAMGKAQGLYPNIPARHTALLRDKHYLIDGGGINARQEVEFFQPPKVGDEITVTGRVVDIYTRRGKPYIVTVAESRNQDGVLIDRVRLTEMRKRGEIAEKWEFLQKEGS